MRCEGGRALCWYPPGFPLLLEQREGALREDSLGLCILKGPQVGSGQNPQPLCCEWPNHVVAASLAEHLFQWLLTPAITASSYGVFSLAGPFAFHFLKTFSVP